MTTYIIKRVLLMIPTFFAVSMIIFFVLNFAPGDPAAVAMASGDGNSGQNSEMSGQQNESYRLFKQQFNIDKPIIINTRFTLDRDDVQATLQDILADGGDVSFARQIEAQEEILDWGRYAVPGLIELLADSGADKTLRAEAARSLAVVAQRPLINPTRRRPTKEERAENKIIAAENQRFASWRLGNDSPPERVDEIARNWAEHYASAEARYHPNKAWTFFLDTRFAKYWGNLARLDFGISHVDKKPVLDKVIGKLRYSITLSLSAVFLAYLISVPLGVWSAINRNSMMDRVVTTFLFMLYSLPSFFVGVFLLNLLTRGTPVSWFPTAGFESLEVGKMTTLEYLADVIWHVALPIICLTYASFAALSRYARTGLLDVLRSDYVRTARAKGLPEIVVIVKHAARNGMIPILTLLATLLPSLIGGSVVVEVVFGIPGMGRYMFESINLRDYNAVMAVLLISCSLTLVGMLLSDISYAIVDPRISFD